MIVRLAVLNALRSPVRTALTATTLVLGTALLTVAMSWLQGVFADSLARAAEPVGHVRIADPEYVRKEQMFPLSENLPETADLVATVGAVPGVLAVYPRIVAPITLVRDGDDTALGEVLGLAVGAPDAWMRERLGLPDMVQAGRLGTADDEAVLGATLAARVGVSPGDAVIVLGATQDGSPAPLRVRVVGIARSGGAAVDQAVFLSLERARWMADIPAGATELLVYGASRDDATDVARSVRASVSRELAVDAWSEREPWAALLGLIGAVRGLLEATIVLVTALGVWNTMMMSVMERQTEIGVLRAMGLSRLGAVGLFVLEALCIAVIGGGVGVGLGALGALWLEEHGLELGSQITQNLPIHVPTRVHADFRAPIAGWAFALGLVTAVLGSAVPAVRAASVQPVDAIRG